MLKPLSVVRCRLVVVGWAMLGLAALLSPASTEEQQPPSRPATSSQRPAAAKQPARSRSGQQAGRAAPAERKKESASASSGGSVPFPSAPGGSSASAGSGGAVPFPSAPAASTPAWQHLAEANRGKRISLDFRGADIDNVLRFFSMASGVTIAKDPGLKGPVTMINAKSLTLDEAFHILEAVLNAKGYKLVREDPVLRAVPVAQRPSFGSMGFGGGEGFRRPEMTSRVNEIRVFELKYSDAQQVARIINDLFPQRGGMFAAMAAQARRGGGGFPGAFGGGPGGGQGGGLGGVFGGGAQISVPDVRASADDYTNSVIVNANPEYMAQVEQLIEQLDKQVPSTMQTRVFPLQYASASDLASVVSSVLLATAPGLRTGASQSLPFEQRVRGGGSSALWAVRTQVVPDERTNSLVVTATPENLTIAETVIKSLDQPVEFESTTYVLPLANAQASDVATLLNQAVRGGGGSGQGSGSGNRRYNQGSYNQGNLGGNRNRPSTRPSGSSNRPGGSGGMGAPTGRARDPEEGGGGDGSGQAEADRAADEAALEEDAEEDTDEPGRPTSRQFSPRQGGFGGGSVFGGTSRGIRTGRTEQGRLVNLLELGGQVTIVPDPNTNSLIINTSPENYAAIRQIVEELDAVPEQVLIEAVIAEATLDASTKLGVEWSWAKSAGSARITTNPSLPQPDLSQGPVFRFSVVERTLQSVLTALATDKRFNVLSTPRIFTSNNRQAQINISQQVPYVMNYRETDIGTRTYNIGYLDVGIVLNVTPHITKGGLVSIEVTQEANEFQGFTTFQAPLISQRSAQTTITVRDGETIILGGMIRDQRDRTIHKVPILGDIPLVGPLFRSKNNASTKTELMVFLTPRVVRNADQARALTDEQRQQIKVVIPPAPGPLPGTVEEPGGLAPRQPKPGDGRRTPSP